MNQDMSSYFGYFFSVEIVNKNNLPSRLLLESMVYNIARPSQPTAFSKTSLHPRNSALE